MTDPSETQFHATRLRAFCAIAQSSTSSSAPAERVTVTWSDSANSLSVQVPVTVISALLDASKGLT